MMRSCPFRDTAGTSQRLCYYNRRQNCSGPRDVPQNERSDIHQNNQSTESTVNTNNDRQVRNWR